MSGIHRNPFGSVTTKLLLMILAISSAWRTSPLKEHQNDQNHHPEWKSTNNGCQYHSSYNCT
jgi:hypothetical protein